MDIAIITSKIDKASMNIRQQLIVGYKFVQSSLSYDSNPVFLWESSSIKIDLYTLEKDQLYYESLDNDIKADIFIFPSRHESSNNIPSLTLHTPGNWCQAEYGGKDKQLSISPAVLQALSLRYLTDVAEHTNYEVMQECTHHGPLLNKPAMFIEIGSSLTEWKDKKAGSLVAQTIMHVLLKAQHTSDFLPAFGIGGLHYTQNFKKLVLEHNIALGHVCPKYALHCLDKNMIIQALEKTYEKVEYIILDWKGMGDQKNRIMSELEQLSDHLKQRNIKIKKIKEVKRGD